MKNIVIVSHKFLTQPDDDFVIYLNKKFYNNVLHIRHSFSDKHDRKSYFSWYKKGKLYKEFDSSDYKKFHDWFIYFKELFFTFKWIRETFFIWDYYIGMDGLCVMFGNILRFFGKVKKTVFWAIDFVPDKRFNKGINNKIYQTVNLRGYKYSDEMWDLSSRMVEAREKFLNIKLSDYKKHRVVQYGVWTERIRKYSYMECEKNTAVFMGHLLPKQGVQLIIKIIPEILKKNSDFKFKIIGDGEYRDSLVRLANDLGVADYCDFLGKIDDIEKVEEEIAKSCLGIAPYIKKLDTWTYYGDPGKVKTYLACGIPVLLTDIPWNAEEIEENKCGKIITEDKVLIVDSIIELMDAKKNQNYRSAAIEYSKRFEYSKIFKDLNF